MACPGRLGIGLGVGFGCFLLVIGAEVYYLIWRKKRITDTSNDPTETEKVSPSPGRTHYARQLLFRWKKNIPTIRPSGHSHRVPVDAKAAQQDPELGVGAGKCDGDIDTEESVDSELMRLHNLSGPPRFLFTIKEETREDLDSNDARSRKGSRARSLSDLVMSLDTPFLTPLPSPPLKNKDSPAAALLILPDSYDNPLFESRPPPSPPPKFKFLRDAEEKLYRRIKEEAEAKLRATQKSIDASEQPQPAAAALTSSQVVPLEMESSPTAARPPPDNKIGCPVS